MKRKNTETCTNTKRHKTVAKSYTPGNQGPNDNDNLLSVDNQFNNLLSNQRKKIQATISKLPKLKKTQNMLIKSLEKIKGNPVWKRKQLDIERNINILDSTIKKIENGQYANDFEEKIIPFSKEYNQRREEEGLRKRLYEKDATDNIPRVKKRKIGDVIVGFKSTNKPNEGPSMRYTHHPNTIGTSNERDPSVVLDELCVELGDPFSKLYMNPHDICDDCDTPMEIAVTHPMLVCPMCYKTRPFLDVTSASMGFGKNVEFNRFNYERKCHLSEKLDKVQAKKHMYIPQEKYDEIMKELLKMRVKPEDVTLMHVHEIVRKIRATKYYTAITQIYSHIMNKPIISFSDTQEYKLVNMFRAVQEPFEKADKTRKNFVAYNYCMHKLVQLLGLDYFIELFPLLKGSKNLKTHDTIWKYICKELDWEFVPSL